AGTRPVAFLCAGVGDQYVGMGWELYQSQATFRQHVDQCAEWLRPHLGMDLRTVLYPPPTAQRDGSAHEQRPGLDLRQMLKRPAAEAEATPDPLQATRLSQPAVFVLEYALAQLWMEWGVRPQALLGYSLGEYVAACLAGVFSLQDALYLVAK